MLGTRQSGLPEFRLADLAAHEELIAIARDDARLILHRDPELANPRGAALRDAALSLRARRRGQIPALGVSVQSAITVAEP